MTAKVRVEFITMAEPGSDGGEVTDQPSAFFGAVEISATGFTPASTSAAPSFGTFEGNTVTQGVARVTAIAGIAVVAVGASPAPGSDTDGYRLNVGDKPLELPINTGQLVAICEATD